MAPTDNLLGEYLRQQIPSEEKEEAEGHAPTRHVPPRDVADMEKNISVAGENLSEGQHKATNHGSTRKGTEHWP